MVRIRLIRLERYAKRSNIPIMQKKGIKFLMKYIKKNNIENVLEIGTAIGYSSIRMALINENIKVTTLEKDEKRYIEAVKNVSDFGLNSQVKVVLADALEYKTKEKYDLIFIDAAKSSYIKYFNEYQNNLAENGVIVSDNLKMHGFVEHKERIKNKNLRQLVRKIEEYIIFLKDNKHFKTTFFDIGDGISISEKID